MNARQPRLSPWIVALASLALAHGFADPGRACHDGSPLILDLNGDGVGTTDSSYPVQFDIDADGDLDLMGWTFREGEEAFLALDLNRNKRIDSGAELFGDATILPTGEVVDNGFDALAVYDRPEFGGNDDGVISSDDLIWSDLLLWVDSNHDGISQPRELRRLRHHGVVAIGLSYVELSELDGAANLHKFRGAFVKQVRDRGEVFLQSHIVDDVFFRIYHPDE